MRQKFPFHSLKNRPDRNDPPFLIISVLFVHLFNIIIFSNLIGILTLSRTNYDNCNIMD